MIHSQFIKWKHIVIWIASYDTLGRLLLSLPPFIVTTIATGCGNGAVVIFSSLSNLNYLSDCAAFIFHSGVDVQEYECYCRCPTSTI